MSDSDDPFEDVGETIGRDIVKEQWFRQFKDLEGNDFLDGNELELDRFLISKSESDGGSDRDVGKEPKLKKQCPGPSHQVVKKVANYKRYWNVGDKFNDESYLVDMPPFDTEWSRAVIREKRFDRPFSPKEGNCPVGNTLKMGGSSLLYTWLQLFQDTLELGMTFTDKAGKRKYGPAWKSLTWQDMLRFHLIVFRMGLSRRSKVNSYFKEVDGDTVVKSCGMSRNQFCRMYACFTLHDPDISGREGWSDKKNVKKYNSLHKINPCWEQAMISFQQCRNPSQIFSLDEAMSKCTIARCGFKQVLKRKPDPCGLKADTLCGSDGYVYNSLIATKDPLHMDEQIGRVPAVCYALLTSGNLNNPLKKTYLDENRIIVTDRHYTSTGLAYSLAQRKTYSVGTCMSHGRSNIPTDIMKPSPLATKLPRSQTLWSSTKDGCLDMCTWMDNQPVSILFSIPDIDRIDDPNASWLATRRWKPPNGTWEMIKVYRPNIVRFFEQHMGGVDVLDHRRKSNHRHFRSLRWPLSAVWCLLVDFSLCNSYLCFKDSNPTFQNVSVKTVLIQQITESLTVLETVPSVLPLNDECIAEEAMLSSVLPSQNLDIDAVRLDNVGHIIRFVGRRGNCQLHRDSSLKSSYMCLKCGVFLHAKYCFELFHRLSSLEAARAITASRRSQ